MKVKMQYYIISGTVIETRNCFMTEKTKDKKVRGQRKAGSTSQHKIQLNEREGKNRLARVLNTNFGDRFLHVVLKYTNDNLPETYEELKKSGAKFLRKCRLKFGKDFKYIMVNANWNPKRNRPARFHHHLVVPAEYINQLADLWPQGEFYVDRAINPGDLTHFASYLYDNVNGLESGEKRYTTSQNLDKPIYTEPKPIDDIEAIEPIENTTIVEAHTTVDEDGFVSGSYMRAICHEKIRVRGGMIIMPKRPKKKKQPTTFSYEAFEGIENE